MNRWLLLERDGGLWAIGHAAVRSVERRAGAFVVTVTGGELLVEGVLGVVEGLAPIGAGPVFRRFWREPVSGLAVHEAQPVVVLDPERPPARFARLTVREGSDG